MPLKFKSNPLFLVKIFATLSIIGALCLIAMGICFCVDFVGMSDCIPELIFFVVYDLVMIALTLIIKFYHTTEFLFTKETIEICNRKKIVEHIQIQDIQSMFYVSFKFRYIITIFAGALNEGGCWKLHIKMKDGVKKELCYFSVKDIKLLQEKLYGDLIAIY